MIYVDIRYIRMIYVAIRYIRMIYVAIRYLRMIYVDSRYIHMTYVDIRYIRMFNKFSRKLSRKLEVTRTVNPGVVSSKQSVQTSINRENCT